MIRRAQARQRSHATALVSSDRIRERIGARLPFELTSDQRRVVSEIEADLALSRPMNRLLQGDVGSGKTAVAVHSMLLAAAHGIQAAIMAPTSILAEQHHRSISGMLEGADVEIGLLTGQTPPAEQRDLRSRLADGGLSLVVGTHALLSEDTSFHRLGLVIIHDMNGIGLKNLDPGAVKLILGRVLPTMPIRLGRVCVINPPWVIGRVRLHLSPHPHPAPEACCPDLALCVSHACCR